MGLIRMRLCASNNGLLTEGCSRLREQPESARRTDESLQGLLRREWLHEPRCPKQVSANKMQPELFEHNRNIRLHRQPPDLPASAGFKVGNCVPSAVGVTREGEWQMPACRFSANSRGRLRGIDATQAARPGCCDQVASACMLGRRDGLGRAPVWLGAGCPDKSG